MNLDLLESELRKAMEDPHEYFRSADLKSLQVASHPDRWLGEQERARSIFEGFGVAAGEAASSEMVGEYRIVRKIARGDLSDVFSAKKNGETFVLKRPRAKAKPLVKQESKVSALFVPGVAHSRLVPRFVETISGDTNVFRVDSVEETLSQLGQRCLNGVDGRHIAWIFKRLLMAIGYSHSKDIVNGAVTPDHIVVRKSDHSIELLGWIHSGKPGSKIRLVPGDWKGLYPDWVKPEKKLSFGLDICMAAKSCSMYLDPSAPRRLKSFLSACTYPSVLRNSSAWDLHDEFNEVLVDVYGLPKFVELN